VPFANLRTVTHALYRRLRKARYRIKGMRVFAVGGVKEGANLRRYVQIQKSIEENQSMPEEIVSALVMSESAKSAASALLASAVQSCSDLKDQVDSALTGEGEVATPALVPAILVEGMLACADQLVSGVKALTGAPEVEVESEGPVSAPGSGTPVTEPVEAAIPTAKPSDEDVAAAVEKILMDALTSMKSQMPGEVEKAALCKAKMSPKMGYKQFLAIQNSHMVRLFDLMLELAPFIMDVASSPAVQEQMHEEHEASESPAQEAMEQATGIEDEGGPSSQDSDALEMAKKPKVDNETAGSTPAVPGVPMAKSAVPAVTETAPITESPIVTPTAEERIAKMIEKAMEPMVSIAAAFAQSKEATEKSFADLSATVTALQSRLQKSRGVSQSIVTDPSNMPGGEHYSGSRNLSAEVRAERAKEQAERRAQSR